MCPAVSDGICLCLSVISSGAVIKYHRSHNIKNIMILSLKTYIWYLSPCNASFVCSLNLPMDSCAFYAGILHGFLSIIWPV